VYFTQKLKTPNRVAGEFGIFRESLCNKTVTKVSYLVAIY